MATDLAALKVNHQVSVIMRIRDSEEETKCLKHSGTRIECRGKDFNYDLVFGPQVNQQEVYEAFLPWVTKFNQGFNVTLMCFGPTGSGKTFSLGAERGRVPLAVSGVDSDTGLIPRAFRDIFRYIDSKRTSSHDTPHIKITFRAIEVDGFKFNNLLDEGKEAAVTGSTNKTKMPTKANEVEVATVEDLLVIYKRCLKWRNTRKTRVNDFSSRTHAIFSLFVSSRSQTSSTPLVSNNLENWQPPHQLQPFRVINFVDLAGSEHGEGESTSINVGLTHLKTYLTNLSQKSLQLDVSSATKSTVQGYRDHPLTYVLRDSFGKNGIVVTLGTILNGQSSESSTKSALEFMGKVRRIVTVATSQSAVPILNLRDQINELHSLRLQNKKKNLKVERLEIELEEQEQLYQEALQKIRHREHIYANWYFFVCTCRKQKVFTVVELLAKTEDRICSVKEAIEQFQEIVQEAQEVKQLWNKISRIQVKDKTELERWLAIDPNYGFASRAAEEMGNEELVKVGKAAKSSAKKCKLEVTARIKKLSQQLRRHELQLHFLQTTTQLEFRSDQTTWIDLPRIPDQ